MNRHSDEEPDLESQRDKIIGLGELSIRKSYYPLLQQRQEALRQSEARSRSILHASPVMQFVIDHNHQVISWNRAIETYSGIRAEDMIGTDGQWRAFYEEKRPVLADIVLDQSLHMLPVLYPENFCRSRFVEDGYDIIRFFPKMGENGKWLHATAVPIRDAKGAITGAIETLEDITERKRAEETLRQSEERYRVVADFTFDWEYWIAPDGEFIYVSPSCERITGHSPEEFMLDPSLLITLTHPNDRAAVADLLSQKNHGPGDHDVLEFRILTRTGEVRWIGHESQPVYTANRDYLGQRGSNRDITERKRAEEALKESEKFLNNVVENIPDMIFVKDARDLRFVRFNRAGEELLGLSREDLYGKNDYDFFPEDEADFFSKKDREVLENRQLVDIPEEKIQTRLKGERILHTKKISITDEGGKPAYLLGISEDITDRRQTEEVIRKSGREWQTTFNAITDPVCLLDDKGRIIRHNRAFETFAGKPAADINGRYCYEVMHGTTQPFDGCPYVKAQKSRQRESFERKIDNRWFVTAVDPVFSDTGEISGGVHILIDITERKRMENALQLARSKINLLNSVTMQEIQAAAFSLTAYHQLLMSLVPDGKAKIFLDKEMALNKKIVDSLNFAKNYQDMGVKPPRWQNVSQVFLFAISHLDFLHISHNLQVEGLEVYADPLLEKVFFNMMQNVLLYGECATEVTVRFREIADGLVLFIEDNGAGIPFEEKQMVFDRGHGKNTGLGLFLTREVLSITGMTIKETGEPGKGARFEILVPKEWYRFTKDPES